MNTIIGLLAFSVNFLTSLFIRYKNLKSYSNTCILLAIVEQISTSSYISSPQTDYCIEQPWSLGVVSCKSITLIHYERNRNPHCLPILKHWYIVLNSSTSLNDQLLNNSHVSMNYLLGNYPITLRFLWDI